MKISERTLRIGAATLLALLFVGASYVLSGPSFLSNNRANAGSTEELLKAYAAKDTDGDGLPDWQEALYGTDPNKAISNSYGIPDGEAAKEGKLTPNSLAAQLPSAQTETTIKPIDQVPGVDPAPGSITEQFSRAFFQEYMQASNGQVLDTATQQQIINKLLAEFTAKSSALFSSHYTQVSLHTDASMSMTDYADTLENVFRTSDVSADANQPTVLMENLIEKNDESARPKLAALAKSYAAITKALLIMHVPPQEASAHLKLIQGFDTLNKATLSVVTYEKDPVGVMGGLSVFQPASQQVVDGFKQIATAILAGGEPAPGTPGALIVNIARSAESPQP